jgi:hypothetical protein
VAASRLVVAGTGEQAAAESAYGNSIFNWMAQQQLYGRLAQQNAPAAGELANFMSENEGGPIGVLYEIAAKTRRTKPELEVYKSYLYQYYREWSKHLEQARLLQEAESAELNIALQLAKAAWYGEQISTLQSDAETSLETETPALLQEIAEVPTDNIAAAHEKALRQLILEYKLWRANSPSESVIQSLKNLADQCPFTHGLSVYEARGWYAAFDPTAKWAANKVCAEQRGTGDAAAFQNNQRKLRLFPNPACDRITILSDIAWNTETRVEIRDMTGRSWMNIALKAGEQRIDISVDHLPPGLYFYILQEPGLLPQSGKIVLVH